MSIRCEGPFARKTKVYMNQAQFGAHRGLKWTNGINLDPNFNYGPCTLIVKDCSVKPVMYRPMMPEDACYDAILRCGVDFDKDDIPLGRACAIVAGEFFADAVDKEYLGEDFDPCEVESKCPAVLSMVQQICGGLGNVDQEEEMKKSIEDILKEESDAEGEV